MADEQDLRLTSNAFSVGSGGDAASEPRRFAGLRCSLRAVAACLRPPGFWVDSGRALKRFGKAVGGGYRWWADWQFEMLWTDFLIVGGLIAVIAGNWGTLWF